MEICQGYLIGDSNKKVSLYILQRLKRFPSYNLSFMHINHFAICHVLSSLGDDFPEEKDKGGEGFR